MPEQTGRSLLKRKTPPTSGVEATMSIDGRGKILTVGGSVKLQSAPGHGGGGTDELFAHTLLRILF